MIKAAEFIVSCAETASNLACVDGITLGPGADKVKTIDEYYRKTRSMLLKDSKKEIILGNYFLSKENYKDYFLKAKKILSQGGESC